MTSDPTPQASAEQSIAEHEDTTAVVEEHAAPDQPLPPADHVSPFAPGGQADPSAHSAPAGGRQRVKGALGPVLNVLDSRFADTNRRLDDTRRSLHEESNLTRWVLERELDRIEGAVSVYTETANEALSYVAVQMRELQDEVRALSEQVRTLQGGSSLDELAVAGDSAEPPPVQG